MLAIVITAYNRAEPLASLLQSLNNLQVNEGVSIPLVISIDNHGTPEVNKIAEDFKWKYGEKEVIIRQEKLGLVKHFMWVGDQTERFEHVVFLEDDLLVAPHLIDYAEQAIRFYEDIDEVAAGSLYSPMLNEATKTKFYQLDDGNDVFFLQHPYWGNIWFKKKWLLFKEYLKTYKENPSILPRHFRKWQKSFKKIYVQYLLETGRTVVIPRSSLVTNNGCGGLHSDVGLYQYQVTMNLGSKKYQLIAPDKSYSKYDANEDIYPDILKHYNPMLMDYDFLVDLTGEKDYYNTPYVLTIKPSKKNILCFSSLMKPTELSVCLNEKGDNAVCLTRTEDIIESSDFYKHRLLKDMFKNYYFSPSPTETSIILNMFFKKAMNCILVKLRIKK